MNTLDDPTLNANGFVIAERLFSDDEVSSLTRHYMSLREAGSYPGDSVTERSDPLFQYQRLMQVHRWDDVSLSWLLDARLIRILTSLLGPSHVPSKAVSISSHLVPEVTLYIRIIASSARGQGLASLRGWR